MTIDPQIVARLRSFGSSEANDLKMIALFGSATMNGRRPSDLDVLMLLRYADRTERVCKRIQDEFGGDGAIIDVRSYKRHKDAPRGEKTPIHVLLVDDGPDLHAFIEFDRKSLVPIWDVEPERYRQLG